MNIIAYIIYLLITYLITVHVGLVFYKNGKHYLMVMMDNDNNLTQIVNKLLLTGYYLLNVGYATLIISFWGQLNNWLDVINSVSIAVGKILLTLGVMHFVNMGVIILYSKTKKTINH